MRGQRPARQPSSQTYFEVLAAVLAIELWCDSVSPTLLLGDNTAALQEVLDLRGASGHSDLAQALAIIRCSRTLELSVAHLPSESNHLADTLSRLSEPGAGKEWPFAPELGVVTDTPLRPTTLWAWLA